MADHLLGSPFKIKQAICDEFNISSFTDDKREIDKIRTVHNITIEEKEGVLEFIYQGNGFLQHMVRIMTGTLLEVGLGKKMPREIPDILAAKERAKAGFMAPAKGLFLEKILEKMNKILLEKIKQWIEYLKNKFRLFISLKILYFFLRN